MGGAVWHRPKISVLIGLWAGHREELTADWLRVWGVTWRPTTLPGMLAGERGNFGVGAAWRMTRVILRHKDSDCWLALSGAWYAPSGSEETMWMQAAADDRITGHSRNWRPWLDSTGNPFATPVDAVRIDRERAENRAKVRKLFHFE